MGKTDQYLEQARRCFRHAAQASDAATVAKYAELGRQFLQLAHIDATIAPTDVGATGNWPPGRKAG